MKEPRKGIGSLFNDGSFTLGKMPGLFFWFIFNSSESMSWLGKWYTQGYQKMSQVYFVVAEFFYAERVVHNITLKFRCLHIDVYLHSMSLTSYFTYCIPWAEFHLPKCRQLVLLEMLQCTASTCMAVAGLTHNLQEMFDLLKLHLKAIWATFRHQQMGTSEIRWIWLRNWIEPPCLSIWGKPVQSNEFTLQIIWPVINCRL